ncbi:TIR-like protein FxsC [Streptomyces chartreusis]
MIAALRAALATAGYDPTPEELAEILWLAVQPRSKGLRRPLSGTPATEDDPTAPMFGTGSSDGQITDPEAGSRALYAAVDWSRTAGAAVSPTRIPTPRALPDASGLARALRPLRTTIRSRTRLNLDIPATVTALADGFRDIILTPEREPLLDLTLLVDDGISMAVWHDVANELHQELHRLKAFRRTRLLGMNTDNPEQVRFTAEPFRRNAPSAHAAAGERNLVLVLTDAVGQAWQSGTAQQHTLRWAAKGPVAIFHVLPQDMWPGTGLPTLRLMASAPRPAAPNHHIHLRHPRLPRGILPLPSPPLPVIDIMRGAPARAWAQLVGAPAGESALHFYDPQQLATQPPTTPRDTAGELSAEDALEEFLTCASDNARRLAAHLACAGSALTVPLMRLVQRSALPQSRPEHLAEVFLAGMLAPHEPVTAEGAEPLPHEAMPWDRRSFAFPPPVADSLRELVQRSDERATHHYVTAYLAQQLKEVQAGAALISDPHGALRARTDLPLGNAGPGTPTPQGPTRKGRQTPLTALTRKLNGLMDRIGAPRLDWIHEAVASGSGTADTQRVADLLTQAAARGQTANTSGDYSELQHLLQALAQELGRTDLADTYRQAITALYRKPDPSHTRPPHDDSRETAPYFFLSYARTPRGDPDDTDPDLWVRRLFHDLNNHIRNMTAVPSSALGFMDPPLPAGPAGQAWTTELTDALTHCRVFVPLYSPRYFVSPWCGREWSAFHQRETHHRSNSTGPAPSAVVPALWAPVSDSQFPEVVRAVQFMHPELGQRYRDFGLYGLVKLRSFRSDYEKSVLRLAQRIIDVGENIIVERGELADLSAAPDAFAPSPPQQPTASDSHSSHAPRRRTPRLRPEPEPPPPKD